MVASLIVVYLIGVVVTAAVCSYLRGSLHDGYEVAVLVWPVLLALALVAFPFYWLAFGGEAIGQYLRKRKEARDGK